MTVIGNLIGTTITGVDGLTVGSSEVRILTDQGTLVLHHEQDCCENVEVEDVTGDVLDLIGGLVSIAEEREDTNATPDGTWTFYEIRTTKGDVTIRWLGTSNGYYSEIVHTYWEPLVEPPLF